MPKNPNDPKKKSEEQQAAEAAAFAAELASANIRKYLELHGEDKAKWVMKLIDETSAEAKKIVDASAALAAARLSKYLALKGGK